MNTHTCVSLTHIWAERDTRPSIYEPYKIMIIFTKFACVYLNDINTSVWCWLPCEICMLFISIIELVVGGLKCNLNLLLLRPYWCWVICFLYLIGIMWSTKMLIISNAVIHTHYSTLFQCTVNHNISHLSENTCSKNCFFQHNSIQKKLDLNPIDRWAWVYTIIIFCSCVHTFALIAGALWRSDRFIYAADSVQAKDAARFMRRFVQVHETEGKLERLKMHQFQILRTHYWILYTSFGALTALYAVVWVHIDLILMMHVQWIKSILCVSVCWKVGTYTYT